MDIGVLEYGLIGTGRECPVEIGCFLTQRLSPTTTTTTTTTSTTASTSQ